MTNDSRHRQRVALYARVSTTRQAEADLSIPDQIKQGEDYCAARGLELVATFVEPGASATDDRRPEFQHMMDAATSSAHPFDLVLVHSISRFFRDQFLSGMYTRKLRKAGVALVSMTQDFQDDPTGNLIRQVLGSFDEYQSRENGKHTLRAMQENARQGFWNGSRAPFGYEAVVRERRGHKLKKVLAIQEDEAAVVRRIFDLALGGTGVPLGIKAIVNQLNGSTVRYRGKPFHIAAVHRILTATTYMGVHHFNRRDARSRQTKAAEQWVAVAVPPIVTPDEFDQVREILRSRSPKRAVPRVVGNATLLSGIAKCGTCGSGMTLRTGKSGRYRYYTCAGSAQKGKTKCLGRSIAMEALDGMILEHLADKLFTPERLETILAAFVARSAEADANRREHLQHARRVVTEAQGKIGRLLELVEQGLMEATDPDLKDRLEAAKAARRTAEDRVRLLSAAGTSATTAITSSALTKLAHCLRQALQNGDPTFRKAYLRLFVDQVIVGDTEIRLRGPTAALARAAESGPVSLPEQVPSFMRVWRPVRDSNPCYQRERLVS
jgi:site-specific DNA recombinase